MSDVMSRRYALERLRVLAEQIDVCAAAHSAAQGDKSHCENAAVGAFSNAARRFLESVKDVE